MASGFLGDDAIGQDALRFYHSDAAAKAARTGATSSRSSCRTQIIEMCKPEDMVRAITGLVGFLRVGTDLQAAVLSAIER